MIYRKGVVAAFIGDDMRIEFDRVHSCGSCRDKAGCGIGSILTMFHPTDRPAVTLPIRNRAAFHLGASVRVGLTGNQLMRAVTLGYLIPMAGLLAGAFLGVVVAPGGGDFPAIGGALAGLFVGTWLISGQGPIGLSRGTSLRVISESEYQSR